MKQVVIMDYSTTSVHIFNTDSDVTVDESYIDNLGFRSSDCYWMETDDLKIECHFTG